MATGDHSIQASVSIDGTPLSPDVEAVLESVLVDDHLQLPAMFVVTFRDVDRKVLAATGVKIGSKVVIKGAALGDAATKPLVTGEVTALEAEYDEYGGHAVVRGYDASHRLHRGRQTQTYRNVTDSDIARTVARRAGLDIGTIDASTTTYDHVSQANISDWEFLRKRAARIDFESFVEDGKLMFRRRKPASAAPGTAGFESTIPLQFVMGQDLLEFRPRVTSAEQVREVEVRAWDPINQKVMVATAPATAASAKLSATPASLAGTFGDGRFVSVHRPMDSQSAVDIAATALAEQLGSSFAEASGVCRGTPTLRAGTPFSVSVVGADFEGQYLATTTRHIFDHKGYRTEFSVGGGQEAALVGAVGGAIQGNGGDHVSGVMVALVTGVDDPQELGRVKIKLPTLADDYESDWARVVAPGAGDKTGLMFLPQVGDEVLVVFEHGDIRRPYVLGGLWSVPHKPSLGDDLFDNGHVRREGVVSRSNHRLVFLDDDQKSGVAIMTGDSKLRIALKSTGTEIHIFADGKITIEATQDIAIQGKSGISIEAAGQLTLKGQSGIKIQSPGVVDIDGSLVQLN